MNLLDIGEEAGQWESAGSLSKRDELEVQMSELSQTGPAGPVVAIGMCLLSQYHWARVNLDSSGGFHGGRLTLSSSIGKDHWGFGMIGV